METNKNNADNITDKNAKTNVSIGLLSIGKLELDEQIKRAYSKDIFRRYVKFAIKVVTSSDEPDESERIHVNSNYEVEYCCLDHPDEFKDMYNNLLRVNDNKFTIYQSGGSPIIFRGRVAKWVNIIIQTTTYNIHEDAREIADAIKKTDPRIVVPGFLLPN